MNTLLGGTEIWVRRDSSDRMGATYLVDFKVVLGFNEKGKSVQSCTMIFFYSNTCQPRPFILNSWSTTSYQGRLDIASEILSNPGVVLEDPETW